MRTFAVRSLLLAVGLLLLAVPCGALPLPPNTLAQGVNFMKTQPESCWDFGLEPIDGGHFGPGSDPFDGQICIYTHTNVARPGDTPFNADGQAAVPVEIVAMTLHAVEPVPIVFDRGLPDERTELYDVVVTPAPGGPNGGQWLVTKDPSGGTPDRGTIFATGGPDMPPDFPAESFFDVFFEFEFIPRDPGIGKPAEFLCGDHLTLTADVPWDSMAPPSYYSPLAGDFYPGLGDPLGDPNVPETLVFQGTHLEWHLRLEPIPEPATLSLLAVGGLALLRRRRRK